MCTAFPQAAGIAFVIWPKRGRVGPKEKQKGLLKDPQSTSTSKTQLIQSASCWVSSQANFFPSKVADTNLQRRYASPLDIPHPTCSVWMFGKSCLECCVCAPKYKCTNCKVQHPCHPTVLQTMCSLSEPCSQAAALGHATANTDIAPLTHHGSCPEYPTTEQQDTH